MIYSVREEPEVQKAVDDALERWGRADDAWDAVVWTLARDPTIGDPLTEGGKARAFTFQGARSIEMPSVTVLYLIEMHEVSVHQACFEDARPFQAGHG